MSARLKPQAAEAAIEVSVKPRDGRAARLASVQDAASESPARRLQEGLRLSLDAAAVERWSPRRTAAFVLATCGGFWLAVATLAVRSLG